MNLFTGAKLTMNGCQGSAELKKSLQSHANGVRHGDVKAYRRNASTKEVVKRANQSFGKIQWPKTNPSGSRTNEITRQKKKDVIGRRVNLMNSARLGSSKAPQRMTTRAMHSH